MWLLKNINGNNSVFSKIGYFSDQEGIMSRYIRESEHWKTHLENTKSFILKASENKWKTKAAILGSGWLLDVPIEQLSSKFEEVWLYDVKHPAQIRRKIDSYTNIKLVETDISGFARNIFDNAKRPLTDFSLLNLRPRFDFDLHDFDFVVSCNLLNQLDIILIDYLKKKQKLTADTELQIRRLIQETHLKLLPKLKSCLISDIEELAIDAQNNVIGKKPLVYTDKLQLNSSDSWVWKFDNHQTYHLQHNTWFNVIGVDW